MRRWLAGEATWSGDGSRAPLMPDDVRIEAARRYIASYELVDFGKTFMANTDEPAVTRIARALEAT